VSIYHYNVRYIFEPTFWWWWWLQNRRDRRLKGRRENTVICLKTPASPPAHRRILWAWYTVGHDGRRLPSHYLANRRRGTVFGWAMAVGDEKRGVLHNTNSAALCGKLEERADSVDGTSLNDSVGRRRRFTPDYILILSSLVWCGGVWCVCGMGQAWYDLAVDNIWAMLNNGECCGAVTGVGGWSLCWVGRSILNYHAARWLGRPVASAWSRLHLGVRRQLRSVGRMKLAKR